MRVQFWGTRGSIAKPGPQTVRYGGNTSCVEVRCADGTCIVLDCGTGAHALGQSLMARGVAPVRGHILIGHTHWDHIQGLPFFAPLFVPGNEWDIYAPRGLGLQLRDALAGQMQYTYFPVALKDLGATIRYHDLDEGTFQLGPVTVTAQFLNHPALTLGYRLAAGGVSLVYATDHEPHARPLPGSAAPQPGRAGREALHAEDRRHLDFIAGADLLIHDAQYTAAEYPARVGWGHSTVDYVEAVAVEAGVRRLALFHHDPMRTDDALDVIVAAVRGRIAAAGGSLDVFAAAEGQVVELVEDAARSSARAPELDGPLAEVGGSVLLFAGDAGLRGLLGDALAPTDLRLDPAAAGRELVALIQQRRPALIILGHGDAECDAVAACREIRAAADLAVRDTPVVIVASAAGCVDMAEGFAAGATDWLTRPCSAVFVRARLRAWLMRLRPRWSAAIAPPDEPARLAALRGLAGLDAGPDERFERITRLAGRALGVPFVALNFVEADHQWTKSCVGAPGSQAPRDVSLCAHTILSDEVLMIADADSDAAHGDNLAFGADYRFRSYAGVAVRSPDGARVGTICVMDRRPRSFDSEEQALLRDLARLAERELLAR